MRITILLALIALLLLAALPLPAQNGQEGNVMMANILLFRIRCPASGYSVQERADAVQRRLNDLIVAGGIDMNTVKIVTVNNTTAIYAGGRLLVTVSECDARANKTTVAKLARRWTDRFKKIYPMIIPPRHGQSPSSG